LDKKQLLEEFLHFVDLIPKELWNIVAEYAQTFLEGKYLQSLALDFRYPYGFATNSQNLFLSDSGRHRICVFDSKNEIIHTIGGGSVYSGVFAGPAYLTIYEGRLYIADYGNSRIQIFDINKNYIFISKFSCESECVGIAIHNDLIYVTLYKLGHIAVYDLQGTKIKKFEKFSVNNNDNNNNNVAHPIVYTLDMPCALLITNDLLYIADCGNNRILVTDLNGDYQFHWGTVHDLSRPHGLSLLGNSIYVTSYSLVNEFDLRGKKIRQFGGGSIKHGVGNIFWKGYWYVADYQDHKVHIFN